MFCYVNCTILCICDCIYLCSIDLPSFCGDVPTTRSISALAGHSAIARLCVAFPGRLNHSELRVALNNSELRVVSNSNDFSTCGCVDNVCVSWNSSQLSNVTFFYIEFEVDNMTMSMYGELLAVFSVADGDQGSSLNFTYLIQPIGK